MEIPLSLREKQPIEQFQSGRYSFTASEKGSPVQTLHDVFTLISKKTEQEEQPVNTTQPISLTPELAIKQLMEFLSGDYYGSRLTKLSCHLANEIKKIKQHNKFEPALELYEGFFELTLIACKKKTTSTLIYSLNKITNFAKTTHPAALSHTIPLFYAPLFRTLYSQALHLYWQENHSIDELKSYDGLQNAKDFLMMLKESLSISGTNENLTQLIRYVKILHNYEKNSQRVTQQEEPIYVFVRSKLNLRHISALLSPSCLLTTRPLGRFIRFFGTP